MDTTDRSRRRVLTGIGAALASVSLAGCSGGSGSEATDTTASQSGDGGSGGLSEPDYGGWLDGVDNYESTVDRRDADEVTISVGAGSSGYRFDPPAVAVTPGTRVVWEWTGNGGSHNVVGENADFESELVGEAGHTFERTFDSTGIRKYYCQPHKAMGMKGAVAVLE